MKPMTLCWNKNAPRGVVAMGNACAACRSSALPLLLCTAHCKPPQSSVTLGNLVCCTTLPHPVPSAQLQKHSTATHSSLYLFCLRRCHPFRVTLSSSDQPPARTVCLIPPNSLSYHTT